MSFCKRRKNNSPRDRPDTLIRSTELPREYFELTENEDDERFVDLTIIGDVFVYNTEDGGKEYDIEVFELPRVKDYEGLSEDIRENFYVWLAHARAFTAEKERLRDVVNNICAMARKGEWL